jgi:hypothetical protein
MVTATTHLERDRLARPGQKLELPTLTKKQLDRLLVVKVPQAVTPLRYTRVAQQSAASLSPILGVDSEEFTKVLVSIAGKVPHQERCDVVQSLTTQLLTTRPTSCKLAYSIARNYVIDYWRARAYRQHYSLDASVDNITGSETDTETLGDVLVGEVDFERRMVDQLDAQILYGSLPGCIKGIVNRRLLGKASTSDERVALHRYLKTRPTLICADDR